MKPIEMDQRQWNKWTNQAREVFSFIYDKHLNMQRQMSHPEMPTMTDDQWKTLCWNFAWQSADAVDAYAEKAA